MFASTWRFVAVIGVVVSAGMGLGAQGATAGIALDYDPFVVPDGVFTGSDSGHVFSLAGLSFSCTLATFTGDADDATASTVPFRAAYSGCQMVLGGIPLAADVTVHSDWALEYVSGSAATSVTANVVVTPAASGPAIEVELPAYACVITFDAQTLSHVVLENRTSPAGVHSSATVTDITYDSDCPGISAGTDGTYDGTLLVPGITITDV